MKFKKKKVKVAWRCVPDNGTPYTVEWKWEMREVDAMVRPDGLLAYWDVRQLFPDSRVLGKYHWSTIHVPTGRALVVNQCLKVARHVASELVCVDMNKKKFTKAEHALIKRSVDALKCAMVDYLPPDEKVGIILEYGYKL